MVARIGASTQGYWKTSGSEAPCALGGGRGIRVATRVGTTYGFIQDAYESRISPEFVGLPGVVPLLTAVITAKRSNYDEYAEILTSKDPAPWP